MAQFLNQEPNPQEKDSAKGATLKPAPASVDWNDAGDDGLNALERASLLAQAKTPATTAAESFASGMGNSIIAAAIRKASSPAFVPEQGFDAKKQLSTDSRVKLYTPNQEEIDYLHGAVSPEDYNYRIQQMLDQRHRDRLMANNTIAGFAGAIAGDSPFLLAPMSAAGIAGRAGLAVRTAIRAADVGTAVYAQDQLGQSAAVTAIVAGVAGLDQLWDMSKAAKAAAKARTGREPMFDPDAPTTRTARDANVTGVGEGEEILTKALDESTVADKTTTGLPEGLSLKRSGHEPIFDPDAPTKRTAPDTVVDDIPGTPLTTDKVTSNISPTAELPAKSAVKPTVEDYSSVLAKELKAPIQVLKGQQAAVTVPAKVLIRHLKDGPMLSRANAKLLDALAPLVDNLPVHLTADTKVRSHFRLTPDGAEDSIRLRAGADADGITWYTVQDAVDSIDADTSNVLIHELIHAATSRVLRGDSDAAVTARIQLNDIATAVKRSGVHLSNEVKYALSSPDEMLAGLANTPEWVDTLGKVKLDNETALTKFMRTILQMLGFNSNDTALAGVLNSLENILNEASKDLTATRFRSNAMEFGENLPNTAEGHKKLLTKVKENFKQNFALYDNIAQGSEDLARLLVSDATAVGGRRPSVVDFKRNLTLEMDASASVVEDAILGALKAKGVGFLDRFFHRSNFRAARADLEDRLGRYLDSAYSSEVNGRPVPLPDSDLVPLVEAYRNSGWASKWHDHMTAAGLVDEGTLVKSDYYFPRQYSYDKMRQGIANGRSLDNYRDLFRQALRDVYPSMEPEVVQRVAKEMVDGIYNGRSSASGPMWKQLVNGMGNDEVVMAMRNAGVDESAIQSFLAGNVRESGATSPAKNLRQRIRFNMDKEYIVDGQVMRMQDLMDTDVAKVMHGYTNRMSGRVGMAYAGVSDLKTLETMINESKHSLDDPGKWEKTVNDAIDFILGGAPADAGQMPDLLRAAGNMANATMLKNSGLYQLTDTALALKEFGMSRVLRSMREQPWFKEGAVAIRTPDMASRLDAILRGSIQKEMRFRWLNTYADDNLDLTRQASWFNVTQNVGQAARHVNGMSMVHRLQVNLNSGIVADELQQMFKGDAEAFKRLERFGLTREIADRAIAASKANPGAVFQPDLQMQVEVVGTRMMDYLVQQVRTGETSHFAQFNPIGKVIVGYQSFALAATNKILRRELNDAGWIGVAHIMAYQFPLMLIATMAKHGMDGKEVDTQKLIAESVMGMSAIGGISLLQDIFTGDSPRHSLASMGYVTGLLGAVQALATGDMDIQTFTKQVPLIQEFAPTRAIINNFGDD